MERINYNQWTPFKDKQGGVYVKCVVCGFHLLKDEKTGRKHCSYMKCKFSGGKEMSIKLDKKYHLKASSLGWDIGTIEPRKQKDGSMKDMFVGSHHFGTLRAAMKGYLKVKQIDADKAGKIDSFKDLYNITLLLEKKIDQLFLQIEQELIK